MGFITLSFNVELNKVIRKYREDFQNENQVVWSDVAYSGSANHVV